MEIKGWKYYNHAAIPDYAPHEEIDMSPILNGDIWKIDGGTLLFARWTTDFDCGYETDWWYVINDKPFDIAELKAKRRYEINKGIKNFDVKEILVTEHKEALYEVTEAAYSSWPRKYRPKIDRDGFCNSLIDWNWYKTFGVFAKETGKLCGYALLSKNDNCVEFNVLRTDPQYEKLGINAAVVEGILQAHKCFLEGDGYICDGSRSINHETAFQDYLEKYFGFKKVYCRLHLAYNPKYKKLFGSLFFFRRIFKVFDFCGVIHKLNGIIKMEEIIRNVGK